MLNNVILNWSEVWAPIIPLYIFILRRQTSKYLGLIAAYLLTALCINAISDVSWLFRDCMPEVLKKNNFLYNINSLCRFVFFTLFFKNGVNLFSKKYLVFFLIAYTGFFGCYFVINRNFHSLNSLLHTSESLILLVFCVIYFIKLIKSDEIFSAFDPCLLIISGLAIYESVNFFVFLFYEYLAKNNQKFAHNIWYVYNMFFVIFCILIARAFLGQYKRTE